MGDGRTGLPSCSPTDCGGVKTCMFVKNSFEYDARVEREAATLAAAGYEVTVVALLVEGVTPEHERHTSGFEVVRIPQPQFGLGRLLRWLERTGGRRVAPPSTASPGRDRQVNTSGGPSSSHLRRGAAWLLVGLMRVARSIARGPARVIKTGLLDRRMEKAGRTTGAAVFHAHDLNTLRIAVRAGHRTGAAVVYDSHELAANRSRMSTWSRFRARRLERRLIRHADGLIVASPSWEQILVERYPGVPDARVAVVNAPIRRTVNPVDLHRLTGLTPGTPILLYQGSIQEHRGIEPAIEAIALRDDVALVIIGYGHHRPALEAMAARLGLADRVRFTGPIPNAELLDYTAAAAIGLCNIVSSSLSYHTSLPNKLFEYLIAGVPVIGSEGPEIARVLDSTGAGMVVPATDPGAIAGAIGTILGDRDRFAAAAVAAGATHHWGPEAEKLRALYASLPVSGEGTGARGAIR